jgi:hypothetical protein
MYSSVSLTENQALNLVANAHLSGIYYCNLWNKFAKYIYAKVSGSGFKPALASGSESLRLGERDGMWI